MNDNWIEIVETLKHCITNNSSELKYQKEIETCLKILGWKSSNKTIQSQLTLGFGAGNTLRPDIILYKNDTPVLPIEIKRPDNVCNDKQVGQLGNYMRQLKLNVGLYFGENIRFYYDNPNDLDNPVNVFTIELSSENLNGEAFCEMLSYEKFDINNLEEFCKEHYNQIISRNNLQQRLSEYFSENNATKNIVTLIKDKFIKEGFEEITLDEELRNLELKIKWLSSKNTITIVTSKENGIIHHKSDDWVERQLRTIGKAAFVCYLYIELKNNFNITIENIASKYPEFKNYKLSSQNTKLAAAKSIFKKCKEKDALINISESKKADENVRKQAKKYLINM